MLHVNFLVNEEPDKQAYTTEYVIRRLSFAKFINKITIIKKHKNIQKLTSFTTF